MRDKARIHKTMLKLEELWNKYPDWRFMQLICNMQSKCGNDMFYAEDELLIEYIKELEEKGF